MPQIAPGVHKVASSFYWFRKFDDGRVEYQFDPIDGHQTLWGETTPAGIVRAGWLPMTSDLAGKIRAYNEFGSPVSVPPLAIDVGPDDVLQLYRECDVVHGLHVTCRGCGVFFRAMTVPDSCPRCKAESAWEPSPFQVKPMVWEDATYFLGIEGRFLVKLHPSCITVE